jgi:hypothetical protein
MALRRISEETASHRFKINDFGVIANKHDHLLRTGTWMTTDRTWIGGGGLQSSPLPDWQIAVDCR